MVLSEEERSFLFNEFTTLTQNASQRDLYGAVITASLVSKFRSTDITLTQQEIATLQSYLVYRKEGLARLTDQRLQHILQSQNSQGFGAGGVGDYNKVGGPGGGGSGDKTHFFHSGAQYNLCLSILSKLNM